jgi:hypothetical protein
MAASKACFARMQAGKVFIETPLAQLSSPTGSRRSLASKTN